MDSTWCGWEQGNAIVICETNWDVRGSGPNSGVVHPVWELAHFLGLREHFRLGGSCNWSPAIAWNVLCLGTKRHSQQRSVTMSWRASKSRFDNEVSRFQRSLINQTVSHRVQSLSWNSLCNFMWLDLLLVHGLEIYKLCKLSIRDWTQNWYIHG